MTYSYLIDISHWQGSVDHAAVARAGIAGCVIKASNGTPAQTTDSGPYFLRQAPLAKAAYPLWGGYHWLTPGNTAAQQVSCFLSQLRAGFGSIEGAVCSLDAEHLADQKAVLTVAEVSAFKREWDRQSGGYPLMLYAPRWYWAQRPGYEQLATLGFAGWWPSAYIGGSGDYLGLASKISNGWSNWAGLSAAILQYSEEGRIEGIAGAVDLNEIRMPLASFRALTTRQGEDMATVPQAAWDRLAKQMDRISDIVDGGKGTAYQEAILPRNLGYVMQQVIAEVRAAASAEQARDAGLLTAVQALGAQQGLGATDVDRIIAAIEANRDAARQEAGTAMTAALARLADAAAGSTTGS